VPVSHHGTSASNDSQSYSSYSGSESGGGVFGLLIIIGLGYFIYTRIVIAIEWMNPFFVWIHPMAVTVSLHPVESLIIALLAFAAVIIAIGATTFMFTLNWFRLLVFLGVLGLLGGYWVASHGIRI
jgi:hypothetical protein